MSGPVILFRCDASESIGFGHLSRCLALAEKFRVEHCAEAVFTTRQPNAYVAQDEAGPYPTRWLPGKNDEYGANFVELALETGAAAVILDVRDELPIQALEQLRQRGVVIISLDDSSDRRLVADALFYPPVPQVARMSWEGARSTPCCGWQWVVLQREYARHPESKQESERRNLLLTMGGSDSDQLTEMALEAIHYRATHVQRLDSGRLAITVIVGPGFGNRPRLQWLIERSFFPIRAVHSPPSLRPWMLEADLALTSFGVTAYELAACSTPALYIGRTKDDNLSATALQTAGAGIVLGTPDELSPGEMATLLFGALNRLNSNKRQMSFPRIVDGLGASRIAEKTMKIISERKS